MRGGAVRVTMEAWNPGARSSMPRRTNFMQTPSLMKDTRTYSMRLSSQALYALLVSMAVVAFVGCTRGGVSQFAPSGSLQSAVQTGLNLQTMGRLAQTILTKNGTIIAPPDHRRSWMEQNARNSRLLYVSDVGTDDVQVYDYPLGTSAGTLTGFNSPIGECVDKAGDVWVTNDTTTVPNLIEYAHGGTSPINTLSDPDQTPTGCSIDRKNGDLAVSNNSSGSVSVYKHAEGNPTLYSDPNLPYPYFLGYDNKGDLFVDGQDASSAFHYAELPRGSSTFTDIALGVTIALPGGVQWDGHHIAVGDEDGVIYQTSGGTVLGSTTLSGACSIYQFFIDKKKVIGPDNCNSDADIYAYPVGGSPITIITSGLEDPAGAVVSK